MDATLHSYKLEANRAARRGERGAGGGGGRGGGGPGFIFNRALPPVRTLVLELLYSVLGVVLQGQLNER